VATITGRMPEAQKPYRLYRGGRAKGKVPLVRPGDVGRRGRNGLRPADQQPERRRRRFRWGRLLAITIPALALFVVLWTVIGYLSVRRGVEDANERLPAAVTAALTPQDGLLMSKPTQILLLGTDGDRSLRRAGFRRSDTIMLMRTDPDRKRISYLSIPRDLRVSIPGVGERKINSAFQIGGPALALRTVQQLTGLEVNHVAIVDFDDFKGVIDALGGITVDVPRRILSNNFDCPFDAQRCQTWDGWRFGKGKQEMDGRRALIYSRIRQNQLDPSDNDLTRNARQQQVLDGIASEVTSVGTWFRLPWIGDDLVKPLTTDLSAGELLQLGWLRFRADDSRALHCRLGGEPNTIGGESVILGGEDNVAALSMFTGRSAPQPPRPGSGTYGAGCAVGRSL
jgi:polyisoprenyl-teichoic acid--peptidoglycan teichoic acid transferase